ncbi:hypothetical protein Y032_0009g686 [Ancylostoma ceylanicum]|uniref:Uncharacterized protein n=1 Tax=Ancylostoma ceylanicum TaxID=53326 RepID=A0A016VK11_9BILA|nr:hypothetical protein Y032_0009g686 [Ancylostoma ceylanicum]
MPRFKDKRTWNFLWLDYGEALFITVAAIKVESVPKPDTFYKYYGVRYTDVYWTLYDWFSKRSIIRDAPKTLKIRKECPVPLERGNYYVLGCEYYDKGDSCHIVRPWYNLTDDEWRPILRRGKVK